MKVYSPKELVRTLQRQGWRVAPTSGCHLVAYSPDGVHQVTFAATKGETRAMKNTISRLRRAGAKL